MGAKSHYVKIFRENGDNCFPINRYPDSHKSQKGADSRYDASRTIPDQIITESDNYGVIPGEGHIILDFDHKELFREFAEENIKNGHMVIETPHGWHIPVKGLTGEIKKVHLFDKAVDETKAVLEIQSGDQYVIGVGCDVYDEKEQTRVFYENKGSESIFDVGNKPFEDFVDFLSKRLSLHSKSVTRSANYEMRIRFKEGKIPTPGTSNNYFFNAGLQCHSDGIPIEEAYIKIRIIYDKWESSPDFSGRSWDNIENKIQDAYEMEPLHEGRPKSDREEQVNNMVEKLLQERKLFSEITSKSIFENKSGYLENVTDELQRDLYKSFPSLTKNMFEDIKFKLVGATDELPETNKDLKVFDNGIFDVKLCKFVTTDDIADMGFKGYNYLEKKDHNIPHKFVGIMFDNVPESEHPRVKAALRAAIRPRLDSRISVIHGLQGVGKSFGLTILCKILKMNEDYAMPVEFAQLINDPFTKAQIKGKTLLVISEMPETYKDFALIKSLTGESLKTERGFYQNTTTFDNKIKIIATTNYLAQIPEKEKNSMYGRRLSLIHNTRSTPYKVDDELEDKIVADEGEKIISWIVNLEDIECVYEDSKTVKKEWEDLSSPEVLYMEQNWQVGDSTESIPLIKLKLDFEAKYQVTLDLKTFQKTLGTMGYAVSRMLVNNIIPLPKKELPPNQTL